MFGTHPGRVRCRVTISCESPAAPKYGRVFTTLVLKTDRKTHVSLVFFCASNLFRVACNLMKFEFMPELNVIPFYTVK